MTEEEYYRDVIAHRDLENGDELLVIPLTYGRARLCIGKKMSGYWRDVF